MHAFSFVGLTGGLQGDDLFSASCSLPTVRVLSRGYSRSVFLDGGAPRLFGSFLVPGMCFLPAEGECRTVKTGIIATQKGQRG